MKRLLVGCVLAGMALGLTGCYGAPVMPPIGIFYSDIQAPLDVDYDQTALTNKTGEATSMSILGLVALGDCSAEAAARDGGIKTITHADYKFHNLLGIIQTFTTVVQGN